MFVQAKNRTLHHEVVNQLCEMILSGGVKKGEMLPAEQKLCEQMGVSRTTVRKAFDILKERKIIESVRGKGTIVISDDFHFVDENIRANVLKFENTLADAVQARMMIEPEIARLACRTATKEDLEKMYDCIKRCNEKEKTNSATTMDLREFHFQVVESTHNPILKTVVELLISLCDAPADTALQIPNPSMESRQSINVSHEMIYRAIECKDEADAYFYMRENIKEFYCNCRKEY